MATKNTYNELSTLIGTQTQVRFQAASFASDSASLFDNEFIGGLNLLSPALIGKSTDTAFQLKGNSYANPFILDGLQVTLEIVNASGLINSAKAVVPSTGSFKLLFNQIIPLLSVDYNISYTAKKYTLDYTIHMDIVSSLSQLENILKNVPTGNPLNKFSFKASINPPEKNGDNPYMIYAPSAGGMNFPAIGDYQIKDVSFDLLTYVRYAYTDPEQKTGKFPVAANAMQITGDALFRNISKQVNLTTQFIVNPSALFLSGDIVSSTSGKPDGLTFNDLVSLVPGVNLSQVLPNNIPFIDSFELNKFMMGITTDKKPKISNIHLSLSTVPSFKWDIIPQVLTLQKVGIDFGVTFGTPNDINASILGTFELDNNPKYLFNVSGTYPQYVFRAFSAWDKTDAPKISDILGGSLGNSGAVSNPFEGNKGSGGTDPVIESVDLTVDAKNKSYSASLLIDPDIKLSFDSNKTWFEVTELGFNIDYLKSNFSADLYGTVSIGTAGPSQVILSLSAAYQKTDKGSQWDFNGSLQNQPTFALNDFLTDIGFQNIPSWIQSGDLKLEFKDLDLSYSRETITSPASTQISYSFSMDIVWQIDIPNINSEADLEAIIAISKDGTDPMTGKVDAIADFYGCSLAVGLEFTGTEKKYTLSANIDDDLIVSGTYDPIKKTASLTFDKLPSLGQVLTFLIKTAEPGMDLILPDPWDVLNDIKIPGHITLDYDFETKAISIEFDYDVDLLLVKLTAIKATYIPKTAKKEKQVMISITGSLITGEDFSPGWNALNPQDAPKVPGKAAPFELKYLGVGQHIAPTNLASMTSVTTAISGLANAFNQSKSQSKQGEPISGTNLQYDANAGWLIGADFSILEVFDMGFIFLDPLLYGLVIDVKSKPSAKPFGGLHFEIMYKKVNDTTGVYYIYLTLPTIMRHLQFGEVSVTLPSLKLWIYTDGSFVIDLGFPYHNNWKDSFALEVFPFIGMGGFYFGVLKGADVKNLPNTYGNGVFNPVIELGIALRVGLGKDINEGILSAGISLTVAGVLRGMMTFYHPKNGGEKSIYFTISAMLAIIGKIYGSINFAIISARLNITAVISVRATFALYQPVHLNFKAYVSVELTVSIHLIFTIHIHLKFHATIKESFTIGHSSVPPWGTGPDSLPAPPRSLTAIRSLGAKALAPKPLTADDFTTAAKIQGPAALKLMFSPHYTTSDSKAQAILMTYIDSYSYDATEKPATAQNSFVNFGTGIVRWLSTTVFVADQKTTISAINAGGGASFLDAQEISVEELLQLADYFAANDSQPLGWSQAKSLLESFFTIGIEFPTNGSTYNGTVFPMIPSLEIDIPASAKPYGQTGQTVSFYIGTADTGYTPNQLTLLNEYLQFLKVDNQNAADQQPADKSFSGPQTPTSTAEIIFIDFIVMMAKQVIQDSLALFKEYDVTTTNTVTFTSLITKYGLTSIDYSQILFDNRDKPLNTGYQYQVAGVTYQLKKTDISSQPGKVNDDLNAIITANFYGNLTAQDIIAANPGIHKVKESGTDTIVLLPGEIIDIPPFVQAVTGGPTVGNLIDVANHYHVNLRDLVEAQLQQIQGSMLNGFMSSTDQETVMNKLFADGSLRLCFIKQMTVGGLVDALKANSTFANLSGMAARFMMHGLQLPAPKDVQKAVNHQDTNGLVGLYKLTRQQLDVSGVKQNDILTMAVTSDPSYSLDMVTVPTSAYTFGQEDASTITAMNASFASLLNFPASMAIAPFMTKEKHFALHTKIAVTTPAPFTTTVKGPDTLWKLDPHLLQVLQNQQGKNYTFQLYSKRQLTQSNVEEDTLQSFYMPSTLLKFQVRRATMAHESKTYIPNVYEIHSVETESIRLLTQIEEELAKGGTLPTRQFRLMYPDKPIRNGYETPHQLIDGGPSNSQTGTIDLFMVQSNLSEISRLISFDVPVTDTEINEAITGYLLEAGVVQTGGYYMHYKNPHTQKGLPDHLFSEKQPDTEITLLISYDYGAKTDSNFEIAPFHNYIAYQGQINLDSENLFLQAYDDGSGTYDPAIEHKAPTAPPGTAGFEFSKTAVNNTTPGSIDTTVENLFHLVTYNVSENADFNTSQAGMPMGPLKQNETNNTYNNQPLSNSGDSKKWNYEAIVSLTPWLKTKPANTDPNLPANSNNPYNAVGKSVQFAMNWVDLFGNELLATDHLSPATQVGYTDAIVQLSEWPHLVNSYEILQSNPTKQEVKVRGNFAINYAPFTPESSRKNDKIVSPEPVTPAWVLKAQNALEKYKQIYYQYTAKTVDTTPDMVVHMGSTIGFPKDLGDPFGPGVGEVPISTFINLIKRLYVYLNGISTSNLKTVPYQIPAGKRNTVTEIEAAKGITTADQKAAFLIANQGLAIECKVGSTISVPSFTAKDGNKTPLKQITPFAYQTSGSMTIQSFVKTWMTSVAFFEVLNPDFSGKSGTDNIPSGTTTFVPVYNYTYNSDTGQATTLTDLAAELGIAVNLLNITNPDWKDKQIPSGTVLQVLVSNTEIQSVTVPAPQTAPYRFFSSTTAISNFDTYTGISAAHIKALNPFLSSGDTLPANTKVILPTVQRALKDTSTYTQALLEALNPSATFPLTDVTSILVPDTSTNLSVSTVLDATWLPLTVVVTQLGTSLELYSLFNPAPAIGSTSLPSGTILHLPVTVSGTSSKPADISDFRSITSVTAASTMLTSAFASSVGVSPDLMAEYNPASALVVAKGSTVYVPCGSYEITADTTVAQLVSAIVYGGDSTQMTAIINLLNGTSGGSFKKGDIAKIPVPQTITADVTETLNLTDNNSIFELQVKTQVSRKSGVTLEAGAPADVQYHASNLNPDYKTSDASGAATAGPPLTLAGFAKEIETALPGFKVATTDAKETDPDSRFKEIWLVNLPGTGQTSVDDTSKIDCYYHGFTLTDAFYYQILSTNPSDTIKSLLTQCLNTVCWKIYETHADVVTAAQNIFGTQWSTYQQQIEDSIQHGNAVYYAIPPLSNYLVSSLNLDGIPIYAYKPGTYLGSTFGAPAKIFKKFKNIDMEAIMKDFLLSIDNFLLPEYAVPAFQLETEASSKYQPYSNILSYKDKFAQGIASSMQAVFNQAAPATNQAPNSVVEEMLKELQIRLSNAYAFDAVGRIPLDTQIDLDADDYAYLHGQADGKLWADGHSSSDLPLPVFSVSPSNIKLTEGVTSSDLVFLFSTKQDKLQRSFPLSFNFKVNKIEHNIVQVKIKGGKKPVTVPVGEWLTMVLPYEETHDINLKIPIPLHNFPPAPSLPQQLYLPVVQQFGSDHAASFSNESPAPDFSSLPPLERAKTWAYEFEYKYQQASQDTLNIGLYTKTTSASPYTPPKLGYDLVDALIQFKAIYPSLKLDLDRLLVQKKGTPADTLTAVRSYEFLVGRVYDAYKEWPTDRKNYEQNVTADENYEINTVDTPNNDYKLNVSVRTGHSTTLTPPVVILDGYTSNYTPTVPTNERDITFSKSGTNLKAEDGQKIGQRTVRFDKALFDILSSPLAKGNISITRNEELIEGQPTNNAFLYQSPQVAFVNPIHPILSPDPHVLALYLTSDGKKPTTATPQNLDVLLASFLWGLNGGLHPTRTKQTIQINCYYTYTLNKNNVDPDPVNNLQVTIPVIMTPPTQVTMPTKNGIPTNYITQIKKMIGKWFDTENPITSQAFFLFDFSVFSADSGNTIPVLHLRGVNIGLEYVNLKDLKIW